MTLGPRPVVLGVAARVHDQRVTTIEVLSGAAERLGDLVEEHLRNEPPVRALSRMCIKDTVVNGTTIPEGAHMLLVYDSGNDDDSTPDTNTGSNSTLDITVTAVDDPSVLVADTKTVAEDSVATGKGA